MIPAITVGTVAVDGMPAAVCRDLRALLDEGERARADRFVFDRHRHEFVAAHALKRRMLSALGGVQPGDWAFVADGGGKPRVRGSRGPWFSLSHAERMVACAVSDAVEMIGVDVEPLDRPVSPDVARTHFAEAELRWLDSLPAAERALGFWRIWTLKEAFVKATGRGLAQPLRDFSFGFGPARLTFHDPALGDPEDWRFEQHVIGGSHLLAVMWRDTPAAQSVVVRSVATDELATDQRHPSEPHQGSAER